MDRTLFTLITFGIIFLCIYLVVILFEKSSYLKDKFYIYVKRKKPIKATEENLENGCPAIQTISHQIDIDSTKEKEALEQFENQKYEANPPTTPLPPPSYAEACMFKKLMNKKS